MATKIIKFEKEDLEVIEAMAKKYNLSLQELGRNLLRRKYPRLQILLTVDEVRYIDSNAKEMKLTRSMYCYQCFKKAIDERLYENLNMLDIVRKSDSGRRSEKVAISFSEMGGYEKMEKFAHEIGVPFSGLIRYFALNVKL